MTDCPYCTEARETTTGLYTHVLESHSEAVLSTWIDDHGISPRYDGQRTLTGSTRRAVADD